MAETSQRTRILFICLRIAVAVGAAAFIVWNPQRAEMTAALVAMPLRSIATAIGFGFLGLTLGSLRWGILMRTCGATSTPSFPRLYQLSLIGVFFGTLIPGAVAGDVVRGLATAKSFEGKGAASSLAVTLLERLCGLGALVLLASTALIVNPVKGVEGVRVAGVMGVIMTGLGIYAVAFGSKLLPRISTRLAPIAARLPTVQKPWGFATALTISIGTQLSVVCMGHSLVTGVAANVRFIDSMVVMPAVTAASYFPINFAGGGPREFAFVAAYRLVGVEQAQALAGALSLFACFLIVAAIGGVVYFVRPLRAA